MQSLHLLLYMCLSGMISYINRFYIVYSAMPEDFRIAINLAAFARSNFITQSLTYWYVRDVAATENTIRLPWLTDA